MMDFDKDKLERSRKEWGKRIAKSMASGGLRPGPELPAKKEITGAMAPGDRCLISDLTAGDVFEWKGVTCILGNGLESNESWEFWVFETQWFSKTSKHINQTVIYLGPLTAEMVRGLLKK